MAGAEQASRIRIDLHIHTAGSHDCMSRPAHVVAAARARGLDRICITDHNTIAVAVELRRRYPGWIVVGEEVRTAEGVDIIGLFLTEPVPERTPARATCERIREQGGVVYVPHPFASGKGGSGRILAEIEDLIDAVEAFNARLHAASLNRRAFEWGRSRGLPLGAGSDAHTLGEVGRAHVELPPFEDERESFLNSLRQAALHGRTSSRLVHVASTYAKVHKRLARAGS